MPERDEISADVIGVSATGFFKSEHVFTTGGRILGTLQINAGKSAGTFQGADGIQLAFKKTNFWKSTYQLEESGDILGTAKKRKPLGKALSLEYQGEPFKLVPGGGMLRRWRLLDGGEEVLCEYLLRGVFKRGAWLRIFAPVEVKLMIFAYCLVTGRWQEESAVV